MFPEMMYIHLGGKLENILIIVWELLHTYFIVIWICAFLLNQQGSSNFCLIRKKRLARRTIQGETI